MRSPAEPLRTADRAPSSRPAVLTAYPAAHAATATTSAMAELVPQPVTAQPNTAASHQISPSMVIYTEANSSAAAQIGLHLAGIIDPSAKHSDA